MTMDALKDILVDLGIPEHEITETALLRKDLQLDSTETVDISLGLKRRFGVNVKLESRKDMTLKDVCEMVEQAIATTATAT
ncbi:acyl carrier protein [Chroococcidiopsis sp. TS-821]|uniref:acyl carrier protein n=1 Tax=Chroococcidiopsis sp. TS-821 TaxID=1378066 RepID=UPI001AF004C8|nr:acyl carrier protein [Chroococcidiopsis sp. TS-821]